MSTLIKLLFLFILLPFFGNSQTQFYKLFSNNGYDFGQGVVQLEDSSYVITGASSSFSDAKASQAFLLKIDSLGNYIWSQNYGGIETDWGRRVLYSKQNGFYICGFTNSIGNGGYDFYLTKTDLSGNQLWEKAYGGIGWEKVNDAIMIEDTNIVMAGSSTSQSTGNEDIYIVKTNPKGDTIWTKTIGSIGDDFATSIKKDSDSTFIVGGQYFNTDSLMTKAFLMKLKNDGSIQWMKQYGKHGNYVINDFCIVNTHINFVGKKEDGISHLVDGISGRVFSDGTESYLFESPYPGYDSYELITNYGDNSKVYIVSQAEENGVTYPDGKDLRVSRFQESLIWDNLGVNVSNTGDDIGGQMITTLDSSVILVGYNTHFGAGGKNVLVLKIGKNDIFPVVTGTPTISDLVQVFELEHEQFTVYPNPCKEKLSIFSPLNWNGKIELLDNYGKQIYLKIENNEVNLTEIQNGIYFLSFTNANGYRTIQKIEVIH